MSALTAPTPSQRPRWGVQASLFQLRQPAFWLFVGLLAIGLLIFFDQESIMSQLPQALTLSWVLVIVYAIPVAFVVYRVDLFEKEPKLLLAAAVIWGGIIACSLAIYANGAWLSVMGKVAPLDVTANWGAAIVGPGVEETLKLMGVAILFLIVPTEFDGVMDGFVYGAMVGLGFTVVENVSYFMNAAAMMAGTADQTGPVWDTFLVRVVGGGPYSHVLFTGLTGMGFAYIVTRPRVALSQRLLRGGLCIATGVTAHFVWNSPWIQTVLATDGDKPSTLQWIAYGGLKGMPFLLLLILLVVFATRSEESNFREIVAGEPSPDVINEDEIRAMRSLLARRAHRTAAARARGAAAGRLVGHLQWAQIEYALIRSRVDSLADPALEAQRQRIRLIRHDLAALPGAGGQMATTVAAAPQPIANPKPAARVAAAPAAAASRPAAPTAAAASAAWSPTHVVPASGMAAWGAPDPSRPALGMLPDGLELVVESHAGAWAQVRAVNGWRGWVDGRVLVARQ